MHASVFELRRYTLHAGRRDAFIALFERELFDPQEAQGMALPGLFRDAENPDRFIWLRAFADMDVRAAALTAFYGGAVWQAHRDAANAEMIDSDDVFLLRPVGAAVLDRALARGPLLCVTYLFTDGDALRAFRRHYESTMLPQFERTGIAVVAAFETHPEENNYPRLPVRTEAAFVVILAGAERHDVAETNPAEIIELLPTTRSRLRCVMTGKPGDFDFLLGRWNVTHRKLRERLRVSDEWDVFAGPAQAYSLLDGVLSVDEFTLAGGTKGGSIRTLDVVRQRWTIHWTTSVSGRLLPPVHGGFDGDRGEFYGADVEAGTPVLARYIWSNCATPSPRWEQAFSTDGGRSWETNWIMEFERT